MTCFDIRRPVRHKPFSHTDYLENDRKGKVLALRFLEWTGRFKDLTIPQRELFKDGDIGAFHIKSDKPILVEIERKLPWRRSGYWQGYPSIDIPYRKKETKSELYIMVNYYWDTIAVTGTSRVLASPVYSKNTRCSGGVETIGEKFFKVDLHHWFFYHTQDPQWKTWTRVGPLG